MRSEGLPITGSLLAVKANEIATELGITISSVVSGEGKSVSEAVVKEWTETTLPIILQNYEPHDIYNAGMTSSLFEDYVRQFDVEMKRQKRNVLLVIDNCPAHPSFENLLAIRVIFLPPNSTSHTQPMDAGVIRCLKAHYRRQLLIKMIHAMDSKTQFTPNLYDAIQLLSIAWHAVTPETINNCFHHCGFSKSSLLTHESPVDNSDCSDLDNIFDRLKPFLNLPPLSTLST
jgi:hypothetical protein